MKKTFTLFCLLLSIILPVVTIAQTPPPDCTGLSATFTLINVTGNANNSNWKYNFTITNTNNNNKSYRITVACGNGTEATVYNCTFFTGSLPQTATGTTNTFSSCPVGSPVTVTLYSGTSDGNGNCGGGNPCRYVYNLVLPVKFEKFSIENNGADNCAKWTVGGEFNVKNYSLQQSLDGSNFSTIGEVSATGNRSYSICQKNIQSGYYRVISNDLDGKKAYSEVIKYVSNTQGALKIPTPFTDILNVSCSESALLNSQAVLLNASGVVVKKFAIKANQAIDTQSLTPGMYVLRLQDGSVQKLMKY